MFRGALFSTTSSAAYIWHNILGLPTRPTKLAGAVIVLQVYNPARRRYLSLMCKMTRPTSCQSFFALRSFYWDAGTVKVRQSTTKMQYGFEYEGAATRLVITPLTERCWMTITGALDLKLGANPLGPAGTGKTESTKDLAKGLGTQVPI